MSDHLLSPDKPIEIAWQTYTLVGNLKALKDIQHVMEVEILQFLRTLHLLSFDSLAKVITIGIEAGGAKAPAAEVIEAAIVNDIGIVDTRATVGEWLILATTPKRDREKKARELENLLRPTNP